MTGSVRLETHEHVAAVNENPEVRAIVLTGTGRAFCAGSDISGLDSYATPWEFGLRQDYGDLLRTRAIR